MKKYIYTFLLLLFLFNPAVAQRRSYHSTYHPKSNSTYRSYHQKTYRPKQPKYYGLPRDSHGRIKRSSSARTEFKKLTGYPHGRKGYVIDHIIPLKDGGCDCPSNMQWQTVEEAKAKDKWE